MKRVMSALAAAALTAGLLSLGPPASAAFSCTDGDGTAFGGSIITQEDVVLGPGGTADVIFEMYENLSCLANYPPSPKAITAARRVIPLVITSSVNNDAGYLVMRGTVTLDASELRNADAGEWLFQFDAGDVEGGVSPLNVLRKTKITFDAGPEPLRRNHRLTLKGTLRAADWQRGSYRGAGDQEVVLFAIDSQTTPTWVPLAEVRTTRHGRYRFTTTVAGTDRYQAVFRADFPSPLRQVESRIDTVAART
jgi:adhesin HecA-like repeat protein